MKSLNIVKRNSSFKNSIYLMIFVTSLFFRPGEIIRTKKSQGVLTQMFAEGTNVRSRTQNSVQNPLLFYCDKTGFISCYEIHSYKNSFAWKLLLCLSTHNTPVQCVNKSSIVLFAFTSIIFNEGGFINITLLILEKFKGL